MNRTMIRMKSRYFAAAALLFFAATAFAQTSYQGTDPVGTLSYALPQTVLNIEVNAVKTSFHAGPYARYAKKYLGIDAREDDSKSCEIRSVRISPRLEADQSRRFLVSVGKSGVPAFLSLTSQGLVCTGASSSSGEGEWNFAPDSKADFASNKGMSSNLTSESTTLYRNVKDEDSYNKIAIQQQMVVAKSPEARAKEAAEMIFNLRQKRIDIVTGNTDATYSGEAMGAALQEIDKLEADYVELFTGYTDREPQSATFTVVPDKKNDSQLYVAFRVSDEQGLIPADNMDGSPYLLELTAEKIGAASGQAVSASRNNAVYRIPAVCTAKLGDGAVTLLQTRVPVFQLGEESTFPISVK
jgi:hypothetical protein